MCTKPSITGVKLPVSTASNLFDVSVHMIVQVSDRLHLCIHWSTEKKRKAEESFGSLQPISTQSLWVCAAQFKFSPCPCRGAQFALLLLWTCYIAIPNMLCIVYCIVYEDKETHFYLIHWTLTIFSGTLIKIWGSCICCSKTCMWDWVKIYMYVHGGEVLLINAFQTVFGQKWSSFQRKRAAAPDFRWTV